MTATDRQQVEDLLKLAELHLSGSKPNAPAALKHIVSALKVVSR
jgi:hypothetical protein